MGKSRYLWPVLAITTVLMTVIIFGGFVYATTSIITPSSTNQSSIKITPTSQPTSNAKTIRIVGLGDSLTKGYGDSTGLGYAGNVKKIVQTNHNKKNVVLVNFAVNGAKTSDLLDQLQTKSGVAAALKTSQYVLLTIGGNDLYKQGQPITETELAQINQRMKTALTTVSDVFKQITTINPGIKIMYVSLYNPYQSVDANGKLGSTIQTWNQEVFQLSLRYPQVTVVPMYDIFWNRTTTYLWNDVFHPNREGYRQMAMRVAQVLEADLK